MLRAHRLILVIVFAPAILCLAGVAVPAGAQSPPKADPSPLAPGDLKRPIFDTQTPVYDTAGIQAKSAGTVVAEVDGRAVTLGDVGDAIRALPANIAGLPFADLYPGVVGRLIEQQALAIQAQRSGVDEDPTVRRRMKAASEQVLANEYLAREIGGTITEAALLDRYNRDVAGKPGPEEVHLRVIMVSSEKTARDIEAELRAGADFGTLAKRFSLDPTASVGGDAGFVTLDKLTPEAGAVAFSMQSGQFTANPVRSGGNWFILKVDDRRREPAPPFNAMREQLRQAMMREGVAGIVKAALANATVREYDVNGKEPDEPAAGAGERTTH